MSDEKIQVPRASPHVSGMVQVIAHRGASKAAPENTVEAFVLAGRMGADAVELDVRRTRDGVLVVHHNPDLADGRSIRDVDATDLPVSVPALGAALDACSGPQESGVSGVAWIPWVPWVNVEIKNDPEESDFDPSESIADETMALLLARGQPERWVISSFRLETIDRCRAIADEVGASIRTAWLTTVVPEDVVELLTSRGHTALHPGVRFLRREAIEVCHEAGIAINTWTCDDPVRMAELIEWGIDGICTNVPDVALTVLGRGPGRGAPI